MPTFKLNDQEIPFEPGDTIIRAAWKQGVEIPHYCWHPGLSAPANCRMCLVELKSAKPIMLPIVKWDEAKGEYVETLKPKLVPACQQPCAEGIDVSSVSEEVKKAQHSVQEMLLLNHPVDCPICDQAGECKLQDYWLDHQGTLKRKDTEPVHKVKAEKFGETIVYDGERCVMCTRCIRFNEEVVGDPVLDMRERGNTNEIILAPGRTLDHKYTLMNEHVCPVGALTSRDFRFKARVWFLKSAPSICTGCATGCNTYIDYDPRTNEVERLRPRDNARVNEFWMCDDGMLSYLGYQKNRITTGRMRASGNGAFADVARDVAVDAAAKLLARVAKGKLAVVLSAQHSSEDNFVLAKLAQGLGVTHMYLAALGGWEGDAILRHQDNNPNRAGAVRVAGAPLAPLAELVKAVDSGAVAGVLVLGTITDETTEQLAALTKNENVVVLATHDGPLATVARIVIPVAHAAEMNGTFVNGEGLPQEFKRAIRPPESVKSAWETLIELARGMGVNLAMKQLGEVRQALTPSLRPAPPAPRVTDGGVAGGAP